MEEVCSAKVQLKKYRSDFDTSHDIKRAHRQIG